MRSKYGIISSFASLAALVFLFQASPAIADSDDMTSWKQQVAKLIAKKQKYPRSAQIRRLEGNAQVKIVIEADGAITSYELLKSTQHVILDKEVDKLIKRLDPLPAPPQPDPLTLTLPLTWRLE